MTIKLTADDATLEARFYSLKIFKDVATLLELKPQVLGYYLHKANNYKTFRLRKRLGGERLIYSPVTPLKIIQRKLNQVLHAVYKSRSPVHGFVRGKSIVTNASRHVRRGLILNFDLEGFFPSIHFGRVKGMFDGKPYFLPEAVAITLAQICCYNKILPAGAPTSPITANMVCAQMDSQFKRLAAECGCTYTRYADDIRFSSLHRRFPPSILYRDPTTRKWVMGEELSKIVLANGFKINPSKTRVLPRGYKQEVTGLLVGNLLNVKRAFVRQVRAMLHAWERWGLHAAADHFRSRYDRKQRLRSNPDFRRVVRGKIEFIGAVRGRDDIIYLSLLDRYLKQDNRARARSVTATERAADNVLERAVWLLEQKDGPDQGTAFAAEGYRLLTAAHVVRNPTEARQPKFNPRSYEVAVLRKNDDHDVAQLTIESRLGVQLRIGASDGLKTGDSVKLLGFPRYSEGDDVRIQAASIVQRKVIHGIVHFGIEPPIIVGNSGGPVLDSANRVVGIAVKGQGESGRFTSEDEVSCFVPIDAINSMGS